MRARTATFILSAAKPSGFPPPTAPEVAFVGRSNVGKSSLLNTLTGVKQLARTSRTPGRTRLLNWFRILPPRGGELHFVDLPGFGFAQASKAERASWRPMVDAYFGKRESLALALLLVDMRRGPEEEETELVAWLTELGVPLLVVLTKVDKLPKAKRWPAAAAARRALNLTRDPLLFSALTGDGTDELWRAILSATQEAKPGDAA